jgi:branched-chain amino acid transport system ATP-binding protein
MKKMLKIINMDAYYGQSKVLEDININIDKGEFVTIIGANGAGKSTIMKCIMGIHKLKKGSIIYKGQDIASLNAWDRAKNGIGYIPEGRRVFSNMTVEENLLMGAYTIKSKTIIARNLEKCYEFFPRLKERRNQKSKTMSGGEQQMLAISRALMIDPELLLVDEISMGLMPILVTHSINLIKELNRDGMTVLLVEQNAKKALDASDRGYVLEIGKIIMEDKSDLLRKNEDVIKAYLGSS